MLGVSEGLTSGVIYGMEKRGEGRRGEERRGEERRGHEDITSRWCDRV